MKKWTIIIGLVSLLFILQLSFLYRGFKENEVGRAEQAVSIARSTVPFTSISSVDYYPGDGGYHIIIGIKDNGEETIAWVQEDVILQKPLAAGVARERISRQLSHVQVKRLLPGMITTDEGEKRPIWDAYYVTKDGQMLYEYFDFLTGERIKKITLAVSS